MKARNKPVATEVLKKISVKQLFSVDGPPEWIKEVREINDHKLMVITTERVHIVTYCI